MITRTDAGAHPAPAPGVAADLEGRLAAALDLARVVVADFGERGYADPERPVLGFGPEKVVAEAAMLAYVAAGAPVAAPVRQKIEALAAQLAPYARSRAALADLTMTPAHVFKRLVPHVLLGALGRPDDEFDRHAGRLAARVWSHAVDESATVLAERHWITGVGGLPAPPTPLPLADSALALPLDLLRDDREEAYGLTHLLFYLTDFGRRPDLAPPRGRASLLADVEALTLRYLDRDDYDLVAELLMAWPQLGEPWSPVAASAFRVLREAEDAFGVLPCGNVDPARLAQLEPRERVHHARARSYHTVFVMGFLCAATLRAGTGVAAPASPAVPAGRTAVESVRALLGAHRARWVSAFDAATVADQVALLPALAEVAIDRARAARDPAAVHHALIAAQAAAVRRGPLAGAAAAQLEAIAEALLVER